MTKSSPNPSGFVYQQRVYVEDTDAGGIVYHPQFIKYCERARTELFRARGFNRTALWKRYHAFFIVKSLDIDYLSPGRMDDLLDIYTKGIELRGASVMLKQEIFCEDRPVAAMNVRLAWVGDSMRPQRMPEEIHLIFQEIME